jgi:predicted DNA-binding protein YlxM (UPF0122 family)
MLFRLFTHLLSQKDHDEMEDHFSRQAAAAEAEVAATQEVLRSATRDALSPLDPRVFERYERHRRRTSNLALAEMATIRDVQSVHLARAFSVLDFAHTERLNRERIKRGVPPL